jgi:uncharacterized protein (TIGR02145 family)
MKMKRIYLLSAIVGFLAIASSAFMSAQVSIGSSNPPHSAAVLDLQSTDLGLLFPKVSIGDVGTFGLPLNGSSTATNATGMVVYNTNTVTGAGVYFWDGLKWVALKESAGAIPVTDVTISSTSGATTMLKGGTIQLAHEVTPPNASNQVVHWGVASGLDVVSIDDDGLVTGLKVGNALISATASSGVTNFFRVQVINSGVYGDVEIDGIHYKTLDFNGDIWMVDFLKRGTPDGTTIVSQYNSTQILDSDYGVQAAGAKGYYYSQSAAAVACPAGWGLPTVAEYNALRAYLATAEALTFGEATAWLLASACKNGMLQSGKWRGWNSETRIWYSSSDQLAVCSVVNEVVLPAFESSTVYADDGKNLAGVRCVQQ